MKYVDFYGDDRLRHKIVYKKGSYSECVYCGEPADTREHVPSKVFLVKPYPEQLGIVPACYKCNNSFSHDELVVSIFIEKLKHKYYGEKYIIPKDVIERIDKHKNLDDQIQGLIDSGNFAEMNSKIERILFKLAIGHSVFEVSQGYCIEEGTIMYSFADSMSSHEIEEFSSPINISEEVLPEMGSRVYNRLMVVEVQLASVSDPNQRIKMPLFLLDWVVVQQSKYEYTSFSFPDKILVKMIINDFLFVEVDLGCLPND